ncbi:diaminopimelate decarboxylase, partial [Streptomyces violaceoruber]
MTSPSAPSSAERPRLPGALDGPRLAAAAAEHGTPLWLYDAATIRAQIDRLRRFDVIRYAQKACSNLHILRLMREEGVHVDAVSEGEIERALAAGYRVGGDDEPIVFTADLLNRSTLRRVVELGIPVNAGSPQMLDQVGRAAPGHPVWIRINPGF